MAKSSVIELNDDELKYALTYLDCGEEFYDEDKHFYVKLYEINDLEHFALYDREDRIYEKYYYILFSSIDEFSHLEAVLNKTTNFISPKIINVTFSAEGEATINISYFPVQEKILDNESYNTIESIDDSERTTTSVVIKLQK